MKNVKGSIILLVAAFIWGTAFVAQVSGADEIGTFTMNGARSFVGSAFLVILALVKDCASQTKSSSGKTQRSKWPIKGGIACGVILFVAMNFQQGGIGMYPEEAAASGRAGFLTATYVVMVAVVAQLHAKKINKIIMTSVLGTIVGMYLLCVKESITDIYTGDILLLMCAVSFTVQILLVNHYSSEDSVKLSCLQFLVVGILSLICSLIFEEISLSSILKAGIPILYLGIMSSGVAYTLQMVGQKYAKPAIASIVMSLESVFAVLAGVVLLHEELTTREIVGCILVFLSVIIAQIPEKSKEISKMDHEI